MSQGIACHERDHRPYWAVRLRRANRSAFNGYRLTTSAYSLVECQLCGRAWRTRAAYVSGLPDA